MLKRIVSILALSSVLFGQNPQSSTTLAQPADVKYNNGVGIGYRVTISSGLNVAVSSGMAQCVAQWIDYAGGTISLTDNTVNYIVLDPTQDCAPVPILASALSQGTFWIAKVTTASGAITDIKYARTGVAISQVNSASGSGGSSGAGGGANATGNEIINGCLVAYTGSGLVFRVSACDYRIAGTAYHSAEKDDLTLAAADPSNPRIDDIIVNTSAVATSVAGTPAAVPVAPTLDPSTQLQLTGQGITVGAAATTPSGLSSLSIYDDTASPPWTCAVSSNLNCTSASNTFNSGADDIEATSAVAGNNFTLTKPSGTIALNSYDTLVFYIRSKANWANAKTLNIFWLNGSTNVGGSVALRTGLLGFSSAITGSYQQIVVPLSSFGAGSTAVNKLKVAVAGGGGSIGFYVASVSLQSGTGGTSSNSVAVSQLPAFIGDVTSPGASNVLTIAPAAVTEAKIGLSDVTTDNVSITKHGFAPKAPNDATKFLDGTGAYTVPSVTAGGGVTGSGFTTHAPTVASGSSAISTVSSTGSSGQPFLSGGSSADPAYGNLAETAGGTGQTTFSQGDILYASASNTLSKLAKSTSATRALCNTGTSNSPAWCQLDLTNAVTGILPAANGGTGNAFFAVSGPAASTKTFTFPNSSANVLTDNAAVTVAQGGTSLATLTAHALYAGNGASAPTAIGPDSSSTKTLFSAGSSADPAFRAIASTDLPANVLRRGIPFTIGDPGGSTLTVASTTTDYITVPFSCTISAYNLLIDAGTITVKFWKVATGTAIPTSGNSISTSGVGISSGTAIHSTTVSDFTTTTVTQNDIMAMNVTAVATAKYVNGVLECDQ